MNQPVRRRRRATPDDAPQATDEGVQTIELCTGEEVYSPMQYHSFRCGGHKVTITPRAGESFEEAAERGMKMLADLTDKEFEHRLQKFRERYRESK